MKKVLALIIALTMLLLATACGKTSETTTPTTPVIASEAPAEEKKAEVGSLGIPVPETPYMIQFAGATSGGSYFLICNAIAEMLNAKYPEYFKASAQSTAGSSANLRAMHEEEVEFAISQAGLAGDARLGRNAFTEQWENFHSVTYLFPTVMHLVSVDDDSIQSFADFKGQKVSVGATGSATELNSRDLCTAYNMTYDDFKSVEYISEAQAVELLKNKQITCANLIAALNSASPTDLMSAGGFKILSFSQEDLDKVPAVAGSFFPYKIEANTYMNQDYEVQTYAVANFLYASDYVSEDVVYAVTKAIFENLDYLKEVYALLNGVSLETCQNGLTVPLASGAEKYYTEKGVPTN